MRIVRIAIVSGFLLLINYMTAGAAGQFDPDVDGSASHWASLPVSVVVDGGTLFGKGGGLALVQRAVQVWNEVPGLTPLLLEPTDTSGLDFNLNTLRDWDVADGQVRIVFDEGGELFSFVGLDPSGGVLGTAVSFPDASGTAIGAVVLINGHSSVEGEDILGILVHELGHVLGLTHTPIGFGGLDPVPPAERPTMYPFTGSHSPASLEYDDVSGLRAIYGK